MRTKLFSVAVAATATLALAACGGGNGDGGGGGQTGAAGGLKGQGSGESCTISQAVPVGAALSLTGAAGSYGTSQQKGLELAAEQLNAKGGVKYDVKIEDDQTDPRQGITVFEGFVNGGKSIIIGPTLSNTAFQAQPVAQEGKTPVLAISNTAKGITAQGDYIFRDSLTEAQVIPQTVKKAKEKFSLAKVVVMYSNDDAFTKSGFEVFDAALKTEGVQVLETITFSKADTDFRALLTQAKGQSPDAIVVSGLIEAAIPLVTQARELGITVPIIGGNGFNNPKLMADAGEAAEGVVVGAAWNSASANELNAGFIKDFQTKFNAAPDQFAAQAHAGLTLIDHAVRSGCSAERDAIRDGLSKISNVPTVLGDVSINADRDAEHPAVVQVVEGGKFTVLQ
ncbi:ABC transporter substrate-binding protein [Intrasporangium calvum]|uniref:ABC transporter substrate-binding protein n=1 Tax=Intrasporangium calvum TaxID=53358 RepID=A0ABT5GKM7_9MICO|nr:ABC transporter substrate-binding protein [Intrasporangium calvum]MDC5698783.1 ABC transporter substrate-binding protein [Intrasporangium calvum]